MNNRGREAPSPTNKDILTYEKQNTLNQYIDIYINLYKNTVTSVYINNVLIDNNTFLIDNNMLYFYLNGQKVNQVNINDIKQLENIKI